jgi:hypothetical protein
MSFHKTNHVLQQKLVLSSETLRRLSLSPASDADTDACPKTRDGTSCCGCGLSGLPTCQPKTKG